METIATIYSTNASSYLQTKIASLTNDYEHFKENIKDRLHFLIEFIKDPGCNGSIVPSSKQLSEKIIRFIPANGQAPPERQHYIEVGPGTGPFTKGIVERLRPQDILDVIELNPSYCESLRKKFPQENVRIHCISITDWNPEYQYDAVISGLPLNGFSPELVQKCFDVFIRITKSDGHLAYFDYPNMAKLCLKFYSSEKKKQLQEILAIKEIFYSEHGIEKVTVTENFPTANISYFKINKSYENNEKTTSISPFSNPA